MKKDPASAADLFQPPAKAYDITAAPNDLGSAVYFSIGSEYFQARPIKQGIFADKFTARRRAADNNIHPVMPANGNGILMGRYFRARWQVAIKRKRSVPLNSNILP